MSPTLSHASLTRRDFGRLAGAGALVLAAGPAQAAGAIRIAVLKTGTVSWELDVIRAHGLDARNGVTLAILEVANNEATRIALQAGDVDMITSDWLLVARERADGSDLTFVPFSSSVGSLMAKAGGGITTLADLKGKTIGVAGGPLDKNWLLLQGLAKRDYNLDLENDASPVFGAPPLLSAKLESGELDAALIYWNFCARLETKGFAPVITGLGAAKAMGASGPISAVGYTFSESWAEKNLSAVNGFITASREAKEILRTSDAEWQRIRPLMNAENDAVFAALRNGFREGIPTRPIADERADATTLFAVLAKLGGPDLVGKATTLPPGTYWTQLING
jgi:NitT/TauT family transport system substrate-binding protein